MSSAIPEARVHIRAEEGDAVSFVATVESVVKGVTRGRAAAKVYLIEVLGWFGPKWAGFSGKGFRGQLAWAQARLTLPPFTPARVRRERCLELNNAGAFVPAGSAQRIHVRQPSEKNLYRFTDRFDPGAVFFWYSVGTEADGRDALMVHEPAGDTYSEWYAGFNTFAGCSPTHLWNISRTELDFYLTQGRRP